MLIQYRYTKTLSALLVLLPAFGLGQVTVSGPTCAIPGTVYQYLISGPWDSASRTQVCVNGAMIANVNGACTPNGSPVAAVSVTWNAGISSGSLNLTSTAGNSSLSVTITTPLRAGAIVLTDTMQSVGFNGLPLDIHCGADSGGSCKPAYQHQWEQSYDNVHWVPMPLATGSNLLTLPAQKLTIYFRRKTTETDSGMIAYSNIAVVTVGPPPSGTVLPNIN